MMKLPAYILLFVFLVFISETMMIPATCNAMAKHASCSECPMHSMMHTMCKSRNGQQQQEQKNNASSSKCFDCPLFSTMLMQLPQIPGKQIMVSKPEYGIPQVDNLADYNNCQWKPPDFSPIS